MKTILTVLAVTSVAMLALSAPPKDRSLPKPTGDLREEIRVLVKRRSCSAAVAAFVSLDKKMNVLAETHGKEKVVAILQNMAKREPCLGPYACQSLRSLTPSDEHLAFLKEIKANLEYNLQSVSWQIERMQMPKLEITNPSTPTK